VGDTISGASLGLLAEVIGHKPTTPNRKVIRLSFHGKVG